MNDKEKLLKHLDSLKKSGKSQATIDIDWLLKVLTENQMPSRTARKTTPQVSVIDLDGGTF
jgi:hypothetical protein